MRRALARPNLLLVMVLATLVTLGLRELVPAVTGRAAPRPALRGSR